MDASHAATREGTLFLAASSRFVLQAIVNAYTASGLDFLLLSQEGPWGRYQCYHTMQHYA